MPPEQLTVGEWAEKYRILDSKSSARPGPWRNSTAQYLEGIMDAFTDYEVERIIFAKPTQVGGTEALQNMLLYTIAQDPAPAMLVYPTDQLAKSVSSNRLIPAIKLSPKTAKLFRENASSVEELQFDGMYLVLAGSNSPSSLASRPIRYLFLDEVDKYPAASGKEADPIRLATERTKTFPNRKIFETSTPTVRTGHIWQDLENADVEMHYFVPCPHCGELIELKWQQIRFPSDDQGLSNQERADMAVYVCQKCGGQINDAQRNQAVRYGEWMPVRKDPSGKRATVAYWLNTIYSPFVRMSEIVSEFLKSKDQPELLQNFVNSWLAEPWEEARSRTTADTVLERQTDVPEYVVPEWTKKLVAGVDVQETSVYWTIRAFGNYFTSQNIAHGQALSWQTIEDVMNAEYQKPSGEKMVVELALIDSGDQTDAVYDFCLSHSDWAVPVKGSSREMMSYYKISTVDKKPGTPNYGQQLIIVDGGKYKDMITARMHKGNGRGSWMVFNGCDREYADQVTAEQKVIEKMKNGRVVEHWRPKRSHIDNHYLDCEVYAMAAADLLGARGWYLDDEDEQAAEQLKHHNRKAGQKENFPEEQWIGEHENWLS